MESTYIKLATSQTQSPVKRSEAVKRLAAEKDLEYLQIFTTLALKDKSSVVRREATSAIGRLRNPRVVDTLLQILNDNDPKVVSQAVRALCFFKNQKAVLNKFEQLLNHQNEMIRETIECYLNNMSKGTIQKNKHDHQCVDERLKNVIVRGDVEEILDVIPDDSIHLTFTSPPYYNARDYTFYKSYEEYLNFLEKIFIKLHRVTKEGRFFILNTSPVIVPRVSRQHSSKRYPIPYDLHGRLVKHGWEFIDDIVWVKPEATVKNRVGGFYQHRKPLAYKPNTITESIMVYRKKTSKLLDWNIRSYDLKTMRDSKVQGVIDTNNVWHIDPTYDKSHSAVFPKKLCEKVIKYYSYKNDLIFDPFAGSGTLGIMAAIMGRNFLLSELDKEYFNVIKERIKKISTSLLFEGKQPNYLSYKQFMKQFTHDHNSRSEKSDNKKSNKGRRLSY